MAFLLDSLHARAGNLLECLDRLREDEQLKELNLDLQFPQIVVVGQESSGKSSVLERLAMMEFFPRRADLCTRMPIELNLRRLTRAEMIRHCEANGQHAITDSTSTIRVHSEGPDGRKTETKLVASPVEAGNMIRDMMEKILTFRNGKNYGVSEDVLRIEVHSCAVPNLTLVDLPGIVSADRSSEPVGIMRATRSLVEKYLRKENTLVLVVCPAYERIANNQGVQMVQEFHKSAHTVGVLTMADMCNYPGPDRFWELRQRLEGTANDCVYLKRGWIAVKNRDNRVHGTDSLKLAEAATAEQEWFDQLLPGYRQSGKVCNDSLMIATVDMLCDYVSESWVPQALSKLQTRMADLGRAETALGTLVAVDGRVVLSPAEQSELIALVNHIINDALTRTSVPAATQAMKSAFCSPGRPQCSDLTQLATFLANIGAIAINALEKGVDELCLSVVLALAQHSSLPWKLNRFDCLRNSVRSRLDELWRASLPAAREQLMQDLLVLGSQLRLNLTSTENAFAAALSAVNACLLSIVVAPVVSRPLALVSVIIASDVTEDAASTSARLGITAKMQHLRNVMDAINHLRPPTSAGADTCGRADFVQASVFPAHPTADHFRVDHGKAQKWIQDHHGKEFHLQGVSGQHLKTDKAGAKVSTSGALGVWATWLVEKVDDHTFMLRNKGTGKYLRIRNGQEDANGGGGDWCLFDVSVRPDNHIILKGVKSNLFLAFNESGDSSVSATENHHCQLKVHNA